MLSTIPTSRLTFYALWLQSQQKRVEKEKAERRKLALKRLGERQARREKLQVAKKRREEATSKKQRRVEEQMKAAALKANAAKKAVAEVMGRGQQAPDSSS